MANINFENCTFNNSTININGNTFNNSSKNSNDSVSGAISLGALLLGSAYFLPSVTSFLIGVSLFATKTALLTGGIYCGGKVVKILSDSKNTNSNNLLECSDYDGKLELNNCIELEPISVRDVD